MSTRGVLGLQEVLVGDAIFAGRRPLVSVSRRGRAQADQPTVESQYFSHLAPNGLRMDASNRPELTKGTVDFLVPASTYRAPHPPPRLVSTAANTHTPTSALPSKLSFFSLPETPQELGRETKPMDFVVMLDLSLDGVRSGFVRTAAESILDTLYGPEACFPSSSRIAFLTFDATVHFYELLVRSATATTCVIYSFVQPGRHQPRILVVPDIEDMFLPTHEGLFADLYASR
jgi:protein transport protein SEC24